MTILGKFLIGELPTSKENKHSFCILHVFSNETAKMNGKVRGRLFSEKESSSQNKIKVGEVYIASKYVFFHAVWMYYTGVISAPLR